MRKEIILLVALILIVIGVWLYLFFISPAKEKLEEIALEKVELSEIKIAQNSFSFLMFIATEKGFFEKEGLVVELKTMSPEDSVSALLAGKVDYAHFLGPFSETAIKASLRNAPIKTIMLTHRHKVFYVIARPELKLNDLKTIGLVYFPPAPVKRYQAMRFIEENDLGAKIITVENIEELNTLLTSGLVDAILTGGRSHNWFQSQVQGFTILDIIVEMLPSSLSARNDKIEKNSKEVQKLTHALEQALEFSIARPEETKELILKFLALEKTEQNLRMIENYYLYGKVGYDRNNVPVDEGAETLIKIIKAGEFETLEEVEKQIVTQGELNKVFDFRFVR